MKIRPVRAEFFHADRRTDMKLIIAYRSFANAPENDTHSSDERHWLHVTIIEVDIGCLPSALLSRLFEIYFWGSMAAPAVALEGVLVRDNTLEPYNNGDKRRTVQGQGVRTTA